MVSSWRRAAWALAVASLSFSAVSCGTNFGGAYIGSASITESSTLPSGDATTVVTSYSLEVAITHKDKAVSGTAVFTTTVGGAAVKTNYAISGAAEASRISPANFSYGTSDVFSGSLKADGNSLTGVLTKTGATMQVQLTKNSE